VQPPLRPLPLRLDHARPGELTTDEAKALIDQWAEMKVFYINVGGGEPLTRRTSSSSWTTRSTTESG
jgi:hypothetical protein